MRASGITLWMLVVAGAGIVQSASAGESEPTLSQLERDFRELPMRARRLTGPLFWLHGDESPERLEQYLGKVAEGGNGCFTAESRPHSDWLGEGWYRDLEICLEAAKKLDLKMWIFDEKWWPSGEVAGEVPQQFGSKYIEAAAIEVEGPTRFTREISADKLIAVLAGRDTADGIDGGSLVDLTPTLRDGALAWDAPAGKHKVLVFSWKYSDGRAGRLLVDGASRDAVDWYIQTVYQPHYDRFPKDFGKTIVGYFYDEPETYGDWGTEVLPLLEKRGVDWKRALASWKFPLAGEEQAAARYQYQDALAEAWGQTLYGALSEWCRKRGVLSIGHFLEHGREYLHPRLCAGNMFQLQKYSDMGAIDAVFRQFVPGRKDDSTYQTPKLGSSISHVYDKPEDLAMVEIFGARGQDLSYPEMKWWTDLMHVAGINFHIPHSFNPRAPYDTDCPPYFYDDGFEPRWPLYRVYADYTTRLSLMLTGGRHVCPVAFLFLGNSYHVGKAIPPETMTTAMQDALFDCDWVPYDAFEDTTEIDKGELTLYRERYRILVVPPVEVIPYATLAKIRGFFESGGIVVGYGFLPTRSATLGKTSADIAALRASIWGAPEPGFAVCRTSPAGGRSYLLPEKPTPGEIAQVFTRDAGVHPTLEVLEGDTGHWLHVLHRVKSNRDIFLVSNLNLDGGAREFRLRATAAGVPEVWDAMRNEITAVPHRRSGKTVELQLTLETLESALLVFAPEKRDLPMRRRSNAEAASTSIPLVRKPLEVEVPRPDVEEPAEVAALADCAWVWYPEGNPSASAPPGTRYFRKTVAVPVDRKVVRARWVITADNDFALFINGAAAGKSNGGSENWRSLKTIEVTEHLRSGANQLAIAATNTLDTASPAGLIGKLLVELDAGDPLSVPIDASWKAGNREEADWTAAAFDDAAWPKAQRLAGFGGGPWGRLGGRRLTLGPVPADPFLGECELPADLLAPGRRIYLEMAAPEPEGAARVTVNGRDSGGMIGAPYCLEIGRYLQPGTNRIVIRPFAPRWARISFD